MLPVDFKYRLMYIGKPATMTDEECMSLPAWSDGKQYVSCWKLNKEELELIQQTGMIYLHIMSSAHPVVSLSTECQVKGDFNVKPGIHVECLWWDPITRETQPISGKVIEIDGTYFVQTDEEAAMIAYCSDITIIG